MLVQIQIVQASFTTFYIKHPIKYVALITQYPYFKALWRQLSRNIYYFGYTAGKAFNRLINDKVNSQLIELPTAKAEVLAKVLYSFKSILKVLIIFLLQCSAVKVAINLLPPVASYILSNNIHYTIAKVFILVILNGRFYIQAHIYKHC